MKIKLRKYLLLFSLGMSAIACKDNWADHVGDAGEQQTLYDVVYSNPEYSEFADLLGKSGYGESLKASKNYTLILPTNEAIEEARLKYDMNDTSVVKSFVGYHLINSAYSVNDGIDTVRALNFRNKYVEFTHGEFDGVVPLSQNHIASNGIYHVVGQAIEPLQNIFTLATTTYVDLAQIKAVMSFDTAYTPEVDGEPLLDQDGQEVISYRTSPQWNSEVKRNMTREDRKFTYFIVDDENYETEYTKLRPFYKTSYEEGNTHRPDSTTTFFAKKAVLRDFIVVGEMTNDSLNNELISIAGTKFRVNPADVIERHKTSNGAVYRVKHIDYAIENQIKEVMVLGKEPRGYKESGKRGNTFLRDKRDNEGNLYQDIEIQGHNVTAFYVKFRAVNMNVTKYKVYGRAIMGLAGDPVTAAFTQYVHFLDPTIESLNEADWYQKPVINAAGEDATRMTFEVLPLNHEEVYLGEVTQDEFGNQEMLVMADARGPIILEYLRFVPIIQ